MTPIEDPHVRQLAEIADELRPNYVRPEKKALWKDSPFGWIVPMVTSRQIGAIAETLIERWCRANGVTVSRSPDSDADRIVAGRRVEIKYSSLWETGIYKFQQFRDQNYEHAICLGVRPYSANCWVISKEVLLQHVIGHTGQHAGKGARDTFWLAFQADEAPDWLRPCGGTLGEALEILRQWS